MGKPHVKTGFKLTFFFSLHRDRQAVGSMQHLSKRCFKSRKNFWCLRTRAVCVGIQNVNEGLSVFSGTCEQRSVEDNYKLKEGQ